jgi:LytS/YehU family sensor histidine kinase
MIKPLPEKAEKMIVEFGGLLRLSLENSREDFVELRDELSALQKYLELYANTVMPFEYNIEIDSQVKLDEVSIPPMLIQPLVENAIKHGIGKASKDGKILVSLSKMNDKLIICQVKDNGAGFINSLGTEKSLALQILKERLNTYAGSKKTTLLSVVDKSQDPSEMTTVKIQMPYKCI